MRSALEGRLVAGERAAGRPGGRPYGPPRFFFFCFATPAAAAEATGTATSRVGAPSIAAES